MRVPYYLFKSYQFRKKPNILAALVFFILNTALAQEQNTQRSSLVSAGFHQTRESANAGLIFRGPGIRYGICWNWNKHRGILSYRNGLGLGILFSRQMPALDFYIKPAEASYLLYVIPGKLMIGPNLKLEYKYGYYPETQSGFDYWFTDFNLGLKLKYDILYRESTFSTVISTSLMGFASRQPESRDPHFYDLGVKYAITHLHQDLNFGSMGKFTSAELEIHWKPGRNPRYSLAYSMEYLQYFDDPAITVINHQLTLIITKKSKTP